MDNGGGSSIPVVSTRNGGSGSTLPSSPTRVGGYGSSGLSGNGTSSTNSSVGASGGNSSPNGILKTTNGGGNGADKKKVRFTDSSNGGSNGSSGLKLGGSGCYDTVDDIIKRTTSDGGGLRSGLQGTSSDSSVLTGSGNSSNDVIGGATGGGTSPTKVSGPVFDTPDGSTGDFDPKKEAVGLYRDVFNSGDPIDPTLLSDLLRIIEN